MCCGNKRARARRRPTKRQAAKSTGGRTAQAETFGNVQPYFKYLGNTSLVVRGPQTQKLYHFDYPGAVVAVDPMDWRSFTAVTILQQVAKPDSD